MRLDISLHNEELYKGLKVHRFSPKRPRLDARFSQENYWLIRRNAEAIFNSQGWDEYHKGLTLVITGSMLSWVTAAILVVALRTFVKVYYESEGVRIELN